MFGHLDNIQWTYMSPQTLLLGGLEFRSYRVMTHLCFIFFLSHSRNISFCHIAQSRRRLWGLTVGWGWEPACEDPRSSFSQKYGTVRGERDQILTIFLLVDMAAHMRCCRLHWRSHQALWEWGEIFWQDRDQGYARDLQEEQEDNRHGRGWVRCAIEKVNLSTFIVHLEDASTRLEPPQWCQHMARWPTFRCGTTFFPTSSCLRWKQGPAPVQFSLSTFQVTGCEEFPEGNLVSWEKTNWFLNSSRGTVST